MDPFSLTVGIVQLSKETYLVANFIYKTLNSAKHSEEERKDALAQIRRELLFFQSFGRYFADPSSLVAGDVDLNERWLAEILDTLERLRVDFADYARLAGREDPEYMAWYRTSSGRAITLTRFPRLWHGSKAKLSQAGAASRWALWDKGRLEATIDKFHKRNATLKEILQLAMATQQLQLIKTEDAKTLGLTAHAEIRRLVAKPESSIDYALNNATLFADDTKRTIQKATCETTVGKGNRSTENVLVEFKEFPPTLGGLEQTEIARYTANIKSRGVVEQTSQSRHAFVFYFPIDADVREPESLHSFIETSSSIQQWPLAARFKIAQHVAKSIGAFHADGWVHKGVRSESIVFFRRRGDGKLLSEAPYLVGFEYSRPESRSTLLLRDNDEDKNLYRHPDIQDVARSSFSKSDDIYSLGVVLLEIALWQTARSMLDGLKSTLKRKGLDSSQINAIGLQKMYIDRTKKRVGHLMGTAFQTAILACLESKYKDHVHRQEFPIMFHDEVTQELSAGKVV